MDPVKGLSDRDSLEINTGMLFDLDGHPVITMRGMKFSLDIVWISDDKKVVDISRNTLVSVLGNDTLYTPEKPAKYALEINAGEAQKRGIKVGDEVEINLLPNSDLTRLLVLEEILEHMLKAVPGEKLEYLKPGEQAPEGIQIQRGARGGRGYYPSEITGANEESTLEPTEEREIDIVQAPSAKPDVPVREVPPLPKDIALSAFKSEELSTSLKEFFENDDVDASLLQDMYSLSSELAKDFGLSFRNVNITHSSDVDSAVERGLPISQLHLDYQIESKLPVPKKYEIGYMYTFEPYSREKWIEHTGTKEILNPSKESDYYTENINESKVGMAARSINDDQRSEYTLDEVRNSIAHFGRTLLALSDSEIDNLAAAVKERLTPKEYKYIENPDQPYAKHVKEIEAKEPTFNAYDVGYTDYEGSGELDVTQELLQFNSPEEAKRWVTNNDYKDDEDNEINEDFIIRETENIAAQIYKSSSHFSRLINKYRDVDTGKVRFDVVHQEMVLGTPYQNKGLATDINEHAEEMYEKVGIGRISLLANYDIGGYAWAIAGYDFEDSSDLKEMRESFVEEVERMVKNEKITDEELQDLTAIVKSFKHPWEFASWNPTDEPAGQHFGKKYMLGTEWYAVKVLDKKSKGYQIGKAYFEHKKNTQTKG